MGLGKILNPCDTDGFFAVDLHVWLLSNLSSIVNTKKSWCWSILFGVTM
jgi:hypothetical protein